MRKLEGILRCMDCGSDFTIWHRWGVGHNVRRCRFCHYKKVSAHRKALRDRARKPKPCPSCSFDFVPYRTDQKYCSVKCCARAHDAERARKVRAGLIPRQYKRKGRSVFAAMITYVCKVCGTKRDVPRRYYIGPKKIRKPQFCSLECWYAWLRKNPRKGAANPSWRGGAVKFRGENWDADAELIRLRDGRICKVCGAAQVKKRFPVDHIVPYRLCGENNPTNLLTLCGKCHARKMGLENCFLRGDILRFWYGLDAAQWPMNTVRDAMLLYGYKHPEMVL